MLAFLDDRLIKTLCRVGYRASIKRYVKRGYYSFRTETYAPHRQIRLAITAGRFKFSIFNICSTFGMGYHQRFKPSNFNGCYEPPPACPVALNADGLRVLTADGREYDYSVQGRWVLRSGPLDIQSYIIPSQIVLPQVRRR